MNPDNIKSKLDTDENQQVSVEELKNNISNFDVNDWYFLEGELEKKNNAVVNLIEKPLLDLIKKNDLFEKYNVTVDELKIMKLACLCYKTNPNKWTGTSLAGYAMYASTYKYGGNIWKYYKEEILPVKGIASTGRTDEGWLSMEGVNGIQQAVAPKAPPVVKKTPTRKQAPGFVQENMTPGERVIESIYEIEGDVTEETLRELKIDESDIKYSLNKIVSRAKGAYFSEFEDCRMEAAEEYKRNGGDIDMTSYINYKLYMFAFGKYCENINNKHQGLVKEVGYNSDEEFCEQVKLFEQFQEQMGKKYPNLGETMESFKKYSSEIEKVKNKYFGGKSENEIKEAETNYTEFQTFEKNKSKEYGITQELLASVNSVPQTSEESQEYFQNLNKVLAYQSELDQEKSKYNGSIEKYHNYITGMKGVQDKYKNINFDIIKEYNSDMAERKTKGLDFDKYGKYTSLLSNNKYVITGLKNIELINGVLNDPLNEQFPISAITKLEKEKIVKQEKTDKRWNRIKENMPVIYQITNSLVGFWNGFIDATIGVGTSLGAMLLGAAKGKDNYEHQLKRKEKRDNFFKINQSTSQKQAVYDPETGSLNFNLDNTVATVSGGVAQMICLIYGGGAIGKGISKAGTKVGVKLGEKAVGKAGLFSSAFITEVGHSYTEAIHSGLDGAGAFGYSMFAASIQGGLELISPNEVLLGKGLGLGKELISNICKNGNREGLKLVGKYFLKTTGREILEENLQEGIQLAAGNLVNDMINGVWNTGLESDWNPKNFLSTAIITTLTTGVTTGFSASRQGVQILNSNQPQLIEWIKSDEGLYEDVIKVIDDTISGRFQIPNVDVNLLQELKTTLVDIHTNPSLIQEGAQPQNNENNEVEKKIDYFDGKSHKFDVNENQARGNSEMMDNIVEEINEQNKSQKLNELRNQINEQYNQATGQNLALTDEQLLSIIDAHEQDGILGELTQGQLKQKVKILSETITDKNVRRFLLEAGFCGKLMDRVKSNLTKDLKYTTSRENMEKNTDRIIPQSYLTNLDFVFRAGNTDFLVEQTGNGNYNIINLNDYKSYQSGMGTEAVIGREGDIPIYSDGYASRQHLKLRIDSDGNVIIRDISTNGTKYFFTDKQSGTQYVLDLGNDRYIENGYKIGEEVNIPRTDGRVTKATITAYDLHTGKYRVEWYENGEGKCKDLTKENLDSVNSQITDSQVDQIYQVGEEVDVLTNDGSATKGTIKEYDGNSGLYRVEWNENGVNKFYYFNAEELNNMVGQSSEVDLEVLYSGINENQLNMLRGLRKGNLEQLYLQEFGEPRNVIDLGNGEKLYVSNCLQHGSRKYIIGYVQDGGIMKLRLFYRSQSEGARRACPGERTDGRYSKGESIPNYSYETTTRISYQIQNKFDALPIEGVSSDPIHLSGEIGYQVLEPEMISSIKIDKLFNGYENSTTETIMKYPSTTIINMYDNLGSNFDLSGMQLLDGKGYTYEHQYLGTIQVEVCTMNINGVDLNFSFAYVKNDPYLRVWVEEVTYADAKMTSFGVYDKQVNASPLTGKPIDYDSQVPVDMRENPRVGGSYIDIRDLYQGNPIINKFKQLRYQNGLVKFD